MCWFTRGENFCGLLQIRSGDWIYMEGQSTGLREVKTSAVCLFVSIRNADWIFEQGQRVMNLYYRGK